MLFGYGPGMMNCVISLLCVTAVPYARSCTDRTSMDQGSEHMRLAGGGFMACLNACQSEEVDEHGHINAPEDGNKVCAQGPVLVPCRSVWRRTSACNSTSTPRQVAQFELTHQLVLLLELPANVLQADGQGGGSAKLLIFE